MATFVHERHQFEAPGATGVLQEPRQFQQAGHGRGVVVRARGAGHAVVVSTDHNGLRAGPLFFSDDIRVRSVFEVCGVIRAYSKPPGKEPDISKPFTIPEGSTILDLASFIHKDFLFHLKYARVWGSAKFDGQRVEKNHILQDRDIVELNA